MASGALDTTNHLLLPLFVISIIVNGTLTLANCVHPSKSRLDRIASALFPACLLVSIVETSFISFSIYNAYKNVDPTVSEFLPEPMPRILVCASQVAILVLYGVNVTLALERYLFTIHADSKTIRKVVACQWLLFIILISLNMWSWFSAKHIRNTILPVEELNVYVCVISYVSGAAITIISTLTFHSLAYKYSKKELELLTGAPPSILAQINQKILVRSMMMNSVLFACQIPYQLCRNAGLVIPLSYFSQVLLYAAGMMILTIELLLTPAMVLYFFPSLRATIWKSVRLQSQADDDDDEESVGDVPPELKKEPGTKRAFAIVRVVEGSLAPK
ncbi:hypothetical protein HDU81_002654 [Chytriomyces hyalinus]|nr:hypothetical protein HDU81_002654 [Chytriomyces hyalinus]